MYAYRQSAICRTHTHTPTHAYTHIHTHHTHIHTHACLTPTNFINRAVRTEVNKYRITYTEEVLKKSKAQNSVLTMYLVIFIYHYDTDVKWRIWISNGPLNTFPSCIPFQLPEILIEIWELGQRTFVFWRFARSVVWELLFWNVTPRHWIFELHFEWLCAFETYGTDNRVTRHRIPEKFSSFHHVHCCCSHLCPNSWIWNARKVIWYYGGAVCNAIIIVGVQLTFYSPLVTWCTNKFNIQQLFALLTMYLSENKQRLVSHHKLIVFYNRD
jgi:hypothetical protein